MINLLFLGEIVGRAGIQALKNGLGDLKKHYQVDYTMINAEGMTNGYGIGKMHSLQLGKLGIDLSFGGEKLFYKIDMVEHIKKAGYMLRPYNMPPDCPGRGYKIVTIKDRKFLIANLIGNSDFSRLNAQNAFLAAESLSINDSRKEHDAVLSGWKGRCRGRHAHQGTDSRCPCYGKWNCIHYGHRACWLSNECLRFRS